MRYFNIVLAAIQLLLLVTGQWETFMLTFALGALTMKPNGHLMACATTCELDDISEDDDCNNRGGLKTVYWTKYDNINWATMATDPLKFNPTTQTILGFTMVASAVFTKLTFGRKQAFYNFTYTKDTDVYTQIITMIFNGKSVANRNALAKAVGCCKVIAAIYDNNCLSRVVGVEWNGDSFEPQITPLAITRHLDASGQFGTDKARDEIDLGGESLITPLYSTVLESAIPV